MLPACHLDLRSNVKPPFYCIPNRIIGWVGGLRERRVEDELCNQAPQMSKEAFSNGWPSSYSVETGRERFVP